MLKTIEIQNFRCFNKHKVVFNPLTILVGANNAGKTTLIEALRLLSTVTTRHRGLAYKKPPEWTDIPAGIRGVQPSLENVPLKGGSLFYKYGNPPAKIRGVFLDETVVEVYVGPGEVIFGVIYAPDGISVSSTTQARSLKLPRIEILPQIGPLEEREKLKSNDYVRGAMNTSLASRHFRNQLYILNEYFKIFKERAEKSWPGLSINDLSYDRAEADGVLSLLVRDEEFVAEVGWMGHGLQMWLQTIWFLARNDDAECIILDEPDVYMHADLQRRLIRLLGKRKKQTIVATHSVEIMAEVNAEDIVIVDKKKDQSVPSDALPMVQEAIDRIGGVHNIHLARLWGARKCLHVEGKDVLILKEMHKTLFSDASIPMDIIPRLSIGGWGGWSLAMGSSMQLKNAAGEKIVSYCILDRDYHHDDEISQRYQQAKDRGIQLHIWKMKEIENYLVSSKVIQSIIKKECGRVVEIKEIDCEIDRITKSLEDSVFDALAHEFLISDKPGGVAKANARARKKMEQQWGSMMSRCALISGKELISQLSSWSQIRFKVSFGAIRLAREATRDTIHPEIASVLKSVEEGRPFGS